MWALRQVSAFGIMRRTIAQRFRLGWPDSDALLTRHCVRECRFRLTVDEIAPMRIDHCHVDEISLRGHPSQQRRRRRRLGNVADDVGVEKIPTQSWTSRPETRGRRAMASTSTSGDRRSASRMPPLRGRSAAAAWPTAARNNCASSPPSDRHFANKRTTARSTSRPRTSKRTRPRSASRRKYFSVARALDVSLIARWLPRSLPVPAPNPMRGPAQSHRRVPSARLAVR